MDIIILVFKIKINKKNIILNGKKYFKYSGIKKLCQIKNCTLKTSQYNNFIKMIKTRKECSNVLPQ